MRKFNALLVIVVLSAATGAFSKLDDDKWENFKQQYSKKYEIEEEIQARKIVEDALAYINEHNEGYEKGLYSFRLGLNEYADVPPNEFVQRFNGFRPELIKKRTNSTWVEPKIITLPASVNWTAAGLVTSVKNQGDCGACWAFSACGALEGLHAKQTGQLWSLSEQNLIDCSLPEGNLGCQGGVMDFAFEYVKQNNGVDTLKSYPYTATDQPKCDFKRDTVGATCSGFVNVEPSGSEPALLIATAAVGPISVAVDASLPSFLYYQGGIYDDPKCSSTALDHGVLVTGYGSLDGKPYWIIKNSWGTSWGIDGYMLMARTSSNMCGVATAACYPTGVDVTH